MAAAATSTDTGLLQYEHSTGHLWATEHCRAMFGLESDLSLAPECFLRTVHPEDRSVALAAVQAPMVQAGKVPPAEFRVAHPSGDVRWYLASAQTEFDDLGKPVRTSGGVRDVTARKRAEQAAEQLSERLLALQDEERQRIGQELHDSTSQHLTAIRLNLTTLRSSTVPDGATARLFDEIDNSLSETTK
jgi:PAS domain S-box-containing protein